MNPQPSSAAPRSSTAPPDWFSEASEARFRALVENAFAGVTVTDAQGTVLYSSPSNQRILGHTPEDVHGRSGFEEVHPDDLAAVKADWARMLQDPHDTVATEFRVKHKDGGWRWVEAMARNLLGHAAVRGVVVNWRDITERKKAEEDRRQWDRKLQEAQKVETIGVLAGGLAHDFNNLLTPILSYAALAATTLEDDAPAKPMMQEIERAARRAADLVSQMLAYAGKGRFAMEAVDLSALVHEMAPMLESLISRKAEVRLQLATGLSAIEGDPIQVRQIVMNLVSNAADSMADLAGTIRVRTGLCYADRQELQAAQHGENLPEGPYVFLEIADSGCGIAPKDLSRIFEPFFTTKFSGRGLGLAAVLGIVRSHKGAITVTSEPGRGTTFRVLFPCAPS